LWCDSITEVNLGGTQVSTIGTKALSCNSVNTISLPSTLKTIGAGAFCYDNFSYDGEPPKETLVVTELTEAQIGYEGPYAEGSPWEGRIVTISRFNPKEQVRAFVERMYTVALGRDAEEAGLEWWSALLLSHQCDGANIANGFVMSDEFVSKGYNNETYISILYRTFLNREPDAEGLDFWVQLLEEKTTRKQVLTGFVNSAEFTELCASYGIDRGTLVAEVAVMSDEVYDFVGRMYTVALGRASEPAGHEYWTIRLMTHQSDGADIATGFIMSEEFVSKNYANEEYLSVLYRTFLNREPEADGLSYWDQQLRGEMSRKEVLAGFVNSDEFTRICENAGINRGILWVE